MNETRLLYLTYGFFITFQQLIWLKVLSNNSFVNIGIQLMLFFIIFTFVLIKKKKTVSFNGYSKGITIWFSIYILIIIISGSYFFDGDLSKWAVGLTPFLYTAPIIYLSYSQNECRNHLIFLDIWKGIAWGSSIVLLVSLFFGTTIDYRISYNSLSASTIGRNGIIVTMYGLFQLFFIKKNKTSTLFLFFGISMILMAGTKTTIAAALIISGYLIVKMKIYNIKYMIIILVVGTLLVLSPVFDQFTTYINIYLNINQLETLTGRTDIWVPLIELIRDMIWFGYGYNAPSALLTVEYFDIWNGRDIIQAHNAWLQSMLNVGLVGTAVLLFVYIYLYKELKKIYNINKKLYFILFYMASFLLIRGITEASFANGSSLDVFLFSLTIVQSMLLTKTRR